MSNPKLSKSFDKEPLKASFKEEKLFTAEYLYLDRLYEDLWLGKMDEWDALFLPEEGPITTIDGVRDDDFDDERMSFKRFQSIMTKHFIDDGCFSNKSEAIDYFFSDNVVIMELSKLEDDRYLDFILTKFPQLNTVFQTLLDDPLKQVLKDFSITPKSE